MSKHTPGPWICKASHLSNRVYLIDRQEHGAIGEIVYTDTRNPADACLIAAAPDLLEALQEIIARWDTPLWKNSEPTGVCINKGRQAIAKATQGDASCEQESGRPEISKLVEQLQVCADAFRAYEMHHRSKGDDQKADANMKLADDALSAIKSAEAGVRHD